MAAKKKKNTAKTASKATTSRSSAKKKPKARSSSKSGQAGATKTTKKKSTKRTKKAPKLDAVDHDADENQITSVAAGSVGGDDGDRVVKKLSAESIRNKDVENAGVFAARHIMKQLPSLSRIMSVVMLIFGIVAVGILFYRVMAVFFVPLFLAAALVVVFRPVHQWLLDNTKGRRPP